MSKAKKTGPGRKSLPPDVKKISLSFRADPALAAAMKRLADENARTVSGELLYQIRRVLKELGRMDG